jgi:hypothetical protein
MWDIKFSIFGIVCFMSDLGNNISNFHLSKIRIHHIFSTLRTILSYHLAGKSRLAITAGFAKNPVRYLARGEGDTRAFTMHLAMLSGGVHQRRAYIRFMVSATRCDEASYRPPQDVSSKWRMATSGHDVRISPGSIRHTFTPNGSTSSLKQSVKPSKAYFEA